MLCGRSALAVLEKPPSMCLGLRREGSAWCCRPIRQSAIEPLTELAAVAPRGQEKLMEMVWQGMPIQPHLHCHSVRSVVVRGLALAMARERGLGVAWAAVGWLAPE